MDKVRAIIADDEPALRDFLEKKLAALWPELAVCGTAGDGIAARELAKECDPDIAFLDIRMPGLSGLEVAQGLPEKCLPVFITAHDTFAVQAFETGAIDYLLKPVTDRRLEQSVARLKGRLSRDASSAPDLRDIIEKIARAAQSRPEYLRWIKVQDRESIRLVSIEEIHYFRAADKYTVVRTAGKEFVIRKTIKDLVAALPPDRFIQIHRGTLVNISSIDRITRSLTGSLDMRVKGLPEVLSVSRAYSHLFK